MCIVPMPPIIQIFVLRRKMNGTLEVNVSPLSKLKKVYFRFTDIFLVLVSHSLFAIFSPLVRISFLYFSDGFTVFHIFHHIEL